jgi:hypothetical protein
MTSFQTEPTLIPDKVMTRPSLGRGTVSFSPILHDELKGRAAAAG